MRAITILSAPKSSLRTEHPSGCRVRELEGLARKLWKHLLVCGFIGQIIQIIEDFKRYLGGKVSPCDIWPTGGGLQTGAVETSRYYEPLLGGVVFE